MRTRRRRQHPSCCALPPSRDRGPLLRLGLRVLDYLTPRLVFDALERVEIGERTERHGHAVVPDDVEVEVLGVLGRIPAAHERCFENFSSVCQQWMWA